MIEEKYLVAYFAKLPGYYIDQFQQYQSGAKFTFNVSPLLVGPLWLLYRKLYAYFFALLGLLILLAFLEAFFNLYFELDLGQEQLDAIAICIIFSLNIGLSFIGNYLYLSRASKNMKTILASTGIEDERIKLLGRRGGVSWLAVAIAILLYCLLLSSSSLFIEQAS